MLIASAMRNQASVDFSGYRPILHVAICWASSRTASPLCRLARVEQAVASTSWRECVLLRLCPTKIGRCRDHATHKSLKAWVARLKTLHNEELQPKATKNLVATLHDFVHLPFELPRYDTAGAQQPHGGLSSTAAPLAPAGTPQEASA
eukprot:5875550-Amphidinium_carterae.1